MFNIQQDFGFMPYALHAILHAPQAPMNARQI